MYRASEAGARGVDPRTAYPCDRHVLFVTAPFGPFSRRLADELRLKGARATRVILNGGDLLDWGPANAAFFRGPARGWDSWIARHMASRDVTDLVVHGGREPFAQKAIQAARRLGVRVHVFEEGYFRPHWITLERDGVNADSPLPRDPEVYRAKASGLAAPVYTPVGKITPAAVARISAFHTAMILARPLFPAYSAPYRDPPLRQALGHIRRHARQSAQRRRCETQVASLLTGGKPFFLALMQRPGDHQLTRTAGFTEMSEFIEHLIADFARNAPANARLVFKCHPLDQGLDPHEQSVRRSAAAHGVEGRVVFIDGAHLPTLVRASRGVVSVNSTGGLAALELGRPTLALGEAIYDMPGLTHRGDLASFWTDPQTPDADLVAAYRAVVIDACQINGAFSTAHGIALAAPEAARRILAAE